MGQEIRKEQPAENRPLSTSTLAHADDRNMAENRAADRGQSRGPDPALREVDRPPVDGGPTLVPPASRAGRVPAEQNRTEGAANPQPAGAPKMKEDEQAAPLFSEHESRDFFSRWDALQVGFIDEPRHAVEQADHLVATTMKRIAEIFAEERTRLEGQWDRGDNVSTEDLRVAMRRYRSFFRRLLSV
jgi:hypothetical protein